MCVKTKENNDIAIRMYSKDNNMDPKFHFMNHLPKLTDIEEMLITRVHVVISVYRLSKGNIGYKANILNMQ